MGIKTVLHPPYSPDLAPCDFWLFHKLRGCRYETIEEMKEAMTKVIDTLTQEDFHGAFQKLLELILSGNLFNDPRKKKGNRCSNNDPLWKHQSESTFTGWRHRILRHCSRSTTRGHASPSLSSVQTTFLEHRSIKSEKTASS